MLSSENSPFAPPFEELDTPAKAVFKDGVEYEVVGVKTMKAGVVDGFDMPVQFPMRFRMNLADGRFWTTNYRHDPCPINDPGLLMDIAYGNGYVEVKHGADDET